MRGHYFFVNDTATTDIYTYLHTLSLHDALPICRTPAIDQRSVLRTMMSRRRRNHAIATGSRQRMPKVTSLPRAVLALWPIGRSEEHTSELQSLMRISYAVFCLKKKRKTTGMKQSQTRHRHITKTDIKK